MFAIDFSGQTRLAVPLHMDQHNRGLADRGGSAIVIYPVQYVIARCDPVLVCSNRIRSLLGFEAKISRQRSSLATAWINAGSVLGTLKNRKMSHLARPVCN